MTIRQPSGLARLLTALLALAVSFAPIPANAFPMSADDGGKAQGQETLSSHCPGGHKGSTSTDKRVGKTCCAAMCVGIASIDPAPADNFIPAQPVRRPFVEIATANSPGELPTPPPRLG